MATGTVSLHSWNDNGDSDEALPAMASNYNARLDMREDFNEAARKARRESSSAGLGYGTRSRAQGRGLRSSVVRPQRLGMEDEDEEMGRGRGTW